MHSARELDTGRISAWKEEKVMNKEKEIKKGRQWLPMSRKTDVEQRILPQGPSGYNETREQVKGNGIFDRHRGNIFGV